MQASVVVAHGLSCSAACGILVPGPGLELVSPTLAGGFLTTVPQGKSRDHLSKKNILFLVENKF